MPRGWIGLEIDKRCFQPAEARSQSFGETTSFLEACMVKSWQSELKERPMLQYSGEQKGLHRQPPSPGETDMQRGLGCQIVNEQVKIV